MLHLRSASLVGHLNPRQVQVSLTRQALSRIQAPCQVTTRERSGLGAVPDAVAEAMASEPMSVGVPDGLMEFIGGGINPAFQ